MKKAMMLICPAWALAFALVLAGCEPFETEVTINSDGTGKMLQRGVLSPAAQAMIIDSGMGLKGYRPVLTEEDAATWRDTNQNAAVKLLNFRSIRQADGSLQIESEVIFIDFESFATSVWGFPLQFKVEQAGEGIKLQFQDPAKLPISNWIQRNTTMKPGAVNVGLAPEKSNSAFIDAIGKGSGKTVVRTTLRLPAGGTVQGAKSDAEKRTIILEKNFGAGLAAYTQEDAASVTWATPELKVRPFETPKSLMMRRPLKFAKPAEADAKSGLSVKLGTITFNQNRTLSFNRGGGETTNQNTNRNLNFGFTLFGPADFQSVEQQQFGQERQPAHMISAMVDEKGRDLRGSDMNIHMNTYRQFSYVNRGDGYYNNEGRIGNANVSVKCPDEAPTTIARMEGYFAMLNIAEEEEVEVRPLKEYLNKPIELPGQTLTFTSVTPKRVEFKIERRERWGYNPMHQIRWYTPQGSEIAVNYSGHHNSSNDNVYKYAQDFQNEAQFSDDGYVIITCPATVREIRVPFKMENVKLP